MPVSRPVVQSLRRNPCTHSLPLQGALWQFEMKVGMNGNNQSRTDGREKCKVIHADKRMRPFADDPDRAICRRCSKRPDDRQEDGERSLGRGRRTHGQFILGCVDDEHRYSRLAGTRRSLWVCAPEKKGGSCDEEDAD